MSPVPLTPHLKPLLATSPPSILLMLVKIPNPRLDSESGLRVRLPALPKTHLTPGFLHCFGHKIAIELNWMGISVRVCESAWPPTCEAALTLSSLMWRPCASLRAEMFLTTIRIHYSLLTADIKPYEILVVTVMQIIWQTWFASAFWHFLFSFWTTSKCWKRL